MSSNCSAAIESNEENEGGRKSRFPWLRGKLGCDGLPRPEYTPERPPTRVSPILIRDEHNNVVEATFKFV